MSNNIESKPKSSISETQRKVAGASGILMVTILSSRLLGLVRNAVISHHLGQKEMADVYNGAFQIPDLLFYLIAGGALSSAFIPVFTEHITKGDEDRAWHVFSTVITVMFAVVSVLIVFGEIFTPQLVRLVNFGFDADQVNKCVPLTRIVLPAQLCFFLGGVLMGSQQSRQMFLIPALGPIIYNIGIILGGVVLFPFLGLPGFCWGALFGALVGNFGLQWWAVKRSGMVFRPNFGARHPDVMRVWKLMLPVVLGVALPQVSIWINRAFSSSLGKGPMSAITNANQLMQVPLGIFAQATGVAIFPTLAALAAQKKFDELRSTSAGGIRSLLFLTIPASVLMIVLAEPIIQLLLQHGKFRPEDTALCASALRVYCAGIFAWSGQSILSRCFYAMQDTKTPVIVGTTVTVFFIPLNILFMDTLHMGVSGLALATSVAATLHSIAMIAILAKRLKGFEIPEILTTMLKISFASAISGVVTLFLANIVTMIISPNHVKIHAMVTCIIGFGGGIAIYGVITNVLKMEELKGVQEMIFRMVKKLKSTFFKSKHSPSGSGA